MSANRLTSRSRDFARSVATARISSAMSATDLVIDHLRFARVHKGGRGGT